jgi:hypothetical protein
MTLIPFSCAWARFKQSSQLGLQHLTSSLSLTEFEHSCGVVQITWAGDQLVELSEFGFDLLCGQHPLLLVVEDAATSRATLACNVAMRPLRPCGVNIAPSATTTLADVQRNFIAELDWLERTVLV